jgi:hypothetical protein
MNKTIVDEGDEISVNMQDLKHIIDNDDVERLHVVLARDIPSS